MIIETLGQCVVDFREAPPADALYVANYFEDHTTTYLKFKVKCDFLVYEWERKFYNPDFYIVPLRSPDKTSLNTRNESRIK